MKPLVIKIKKDFVGRTFELERLNKIATSKEASIIVMYGRRRIGKTELLEQAFRLRNLLKFEGIEGLSEKAQFANVMSQLAGYAQDPLLAKTAIESWREFFLLLAKYTRRGTWTIYLVLCGSAPSFMLDNVVHSKALYNRSQYEFHLKEFNLAETKMFLKNRSNREVLDAYLTVGGFPEYLKWVTRESSIFLSLCKSSFTSVGFFRY